MPFNMTPEAGGYRVSNRDGSSRWIGSTPEIDAEYERFKSDQQNGAAPPTPQLTGSSGWQGADQLSSMGFGSPEMKQAQTGIPQPAPPAAPPTGWAPAGSSPIARAGQPTPAPANAESDRLTPAEKQAYLFAPPPPAAGAGPMRAVPKSLTMTVEGAVPDRPEFQEARADAANRYRDTILANQEIQRRAAENEALAWRAQNAELANKAAQQEAELAAKQQAYDDQRGRLQAAADAIGKKQVDPGRIFRGAGAISAIGYIISDALGSYSAALIGQQHQSLMQRVIDRDVALQEHEIQREGDRANNALAGLIREYNGDKQQATATLKYLMTSAAQAKAQELAALTRGNQNQAAAAELLAKFDMQREQQEEDIARRSAGKVTTKMVTGYQSAAAVGAGMTPELLRKRAEALTAVDKALGGSEKKMEPYQQERFIVEYGKKRGEIEEARQSTMRLLQTAGLALNGGIVSLPEGVDVPGHGRFEGNLPQSLLSQRGEAVRQLKDKAIALYLHATTGAAATDAEVRRAVNSQFGHSDEGLARGLQEMLDALSTREQQNDATFGPYVRSMNRMYQQQTAPLDKADKQQLTREPY